MKSLFDARRLHEKFYGLRRSKDDSAVEDWYFVLIPHRKDRGTYDRAAIAAMEAYADACEGYAPDLAADLRKSAKNHRDGYFLQRLYDAGWER